MAIREFISNFLSAWDEAYKYAELDFYKLRNEVTSLLDRARSKGYANPDYCEIRIHIVNSYKTDVFVEAYYKRDGKFFRFKKNLDLGKLVNIPCTIASVLREKGEVSVKLSDFQSLYSIKDDVIKPVGDFRGIHSFTFSGVSEQPVSKELVIKDELFYYQVDCSYVYTSGRKEIRTKYFGYITNLPEDVKNSILSSEDHS
ncbi:MAG: hypothetical protein HDS04_00975, partial [Bacteroides sp.]|nr:hypothetical protein [Bacteroides sp.]